MSRGIAVSAAALLLGCVTGNVREREVGALGRYRELGVQVAAPRGAAPSAAVSEQIQRSVEEGLQAWNQHPRKDAAAKALLVEPEILEVRRATAPENALTTGIAAAGSFLGLTGGLDVNRVSLLLTLRAPGEREPVARLLWEGGAGGPLDPFVRDASQRAGEALAKEMLNREDQFVTRRPADERLIFTPTALLLEPGEWVVSDDQVLLFHFGVGVTRWLELNFTLGGLPVPAAGGVPFVGHGIGGAGGAGAVVLAALDVGLRVQLLPEGPSWPGVVASYDLLDAFGAALGGAGIFFAGNGIAGVGIGGAAAANVQLNVLTAAASKHFGFFQVGGGLAVFDNHHFLPQSAAFGVVDSTGSATGGTYDLEMLPPVFIPFVNAELSPWPWLRLIQEVFPQKSVAESFAATGLRLAGGSNGTWGPLALSKIRYKIDLALIESYYDHRSTGGKAGWLFLPWAGAAIYFM